jgi:microcin C transport system ATP-binding protein
MADCSSSSQAMESFQQPILEVRDVSIAFREQKVLKNISLDVCPGQTVAIIGESGCGKT